MLYILYLQLNLGLMDIGGANGVSSISAIANTPVSTFEYDGGMYTSTEYTDAFFPGMNPITCALYTGPVDSMAPPRRPVNVSCTVHIGHLIAYPGECC